MKGAEQQPSAAASSAEASEAPSAPSLFNALGIDLLVDPAAASRRLSSSSASNPSQVSGQPHA